MDNVNVYILNDVNDTLETTLSKISPNIKLAKLRLSIGESKNFNNDIISPVIFLFRISKLLKEINEFAEKR